MACHKNKADASATPKKNEVAIKSVVRIVVLEGRRVRFVVMALAVWGLDFCHASFLGSSLVVVGVIKIDKT